MNVSDSEMKKQAVEIINRAILSETENVENNILAIEKDEKGNVTLINANTIQLNKLASEVSLECTKKLNEAGEQGIKIPLGSITKNGIFSATGPKIKVKMQQIGNIDTKYYSEFKEAGINQTRLVIYMEVIAKIRVIVPSKEEEIEVVHKVPISETIIVGKVPETSIDFSGVEK